MRFDIQKPNQFNFFVKNKAPLVNEGWLKISSVPMLNEEFHAVHEIDGVKNHKKLDLVNNFINFKLNLFAGFLCVCLLCLVLKFLIVSSKIKKRDPVPQASSTNNLNESRPNWTQVIRKFATVSFAPFFKYRIASLSLLLLFYDQFLWLSTLVVTSSINTDTVIVDTR